LKTLEYKMTFQSTNFDMSNVMNKLRAIAEEGTEQVNELNDDMATGGKEIDTAGFTRTMSRIAAIKDAVAEEHYNALKAGVRALYMNRRPNLQQMTALMDLLETVLAYVSQDQALFQRLKADLNKDADAAADTTAAPAAAEPAMAGAPATQQATPEQPAMRGLK
jgi:hypothetical protein